MPPADVAAWREDAKGRAIAGPAQAYGEPEFLEALRKFYDWETSKNVYPEKVSDLVAWKLILRLLRT